jgi:hypothetical protein
MVSKQQGAQVINLAAGHYAGNPESLPTFTKVTSSLDSYMQRVPWWVVAVGTVLAYRYFLSKAKG